MKLKLQKRFKRLYPKNRLLAIHLDGFTHSVVMDGGKKNSEVLFDRFSHCMPEGGWSKEACAMFRDMPNYIYQNNAKELLYVLPEDR